VGGTPCQAFSVAGNRESLADARGNLTLTYVELADAIDRQRIARGEQPTIICWENVPGVLSTKDNAFGCFLAGLAGEDVPLQPPGKRWSNAGLVLGPKRAVAWRILDAQYFGVAQRRRRVFVVASARNGFDPSQILFEFDGLRRDSAPRRETRQDSTGDAGPGFEVAGTLDSRVSGGGFPGSDGAMGGHVVPSQKWPADIASTLNAAFGSKLGLEDQHINSGAPLFVPAVANTIGSSPSCHTSPNAASGQGDVMVFDVYNQTTDPYVSKTVSARNDQDTASVVCITGDITHALNTANNGKGSSEDGTGRGVPTIAQTVALRGRDGGATAELGGEVATALRASTGGGDKPHVMSQMAVRRLTPEECERLQGFPDGHTLVPIRNKPAADGPRYKACGNSMAVPVMAWIGRRIAAYLR